MKLYKTASYNRYEKKFFKEHKDLLDKYAEVLKKLQNNPFDNSLKTHKLKGSLSEYYSCSLTYKFRLILTIKIVDDKIILVNIGNHNQIY